MVVAQSICKTMKQVSEQIIMLHRHAPMKPNQGQPCNGCGACCVAEPCPVSLALLKQNQTQCRALEWHEAQNRYYCGMVISPSHYLRWLPKRLNRFASKAFMRWIAADQSCDFDAEVTPS